MKRIAFFRIVAPVLAAVALLAFGGARGEAAPPAPRFGAIRWDAWCGDQCGPGRAVEASLGPEKWHDRLPFFAEVRGKDRVGLDGTAQETVDREIDFAARAGLAYWAFDDYPVDDPLSLAFRRYLASSRRSRIGFCMIEACGALMVTERRERLLSLLSEPGYVMVEGNRPLIYLGFLSEKLLGRYGKTVETFRALLDAFRGRVRAAGLGDPYIVIMDFTPAQGKKWADALGAQAITAYDASGPGQGALYQDLARYAEAFWDSCRATGASVVPIVMAGHDRRPRVEHPVPWEAGQQPGVGIEKYYVQPKPEELAAHVARARDWLRAHPEAAPGQVALIYAWNEIDEGGWLVPTLAEGAARIDALAPVLAPAH